MNRQDYSSHARSLSEIHTAVLLFGVAGLFGKLVHLPASLIVLGRVFFAAVALLVTIRLLNVGSPPKGVKQILSLSFLGVLLSFHWTAFFTSVQVSTVTIAMLSVSTFPVFAAFIEPWFFRHRVRSADVILALVAFVGVAVVVSQPQAESGNMIEGIIWGVAAAFSFAIFSVLNRRLVRQIASFYIAFYESVVATICLLPFLFTYQGDIRLKDIALLVVLGVLCTAVAHSLFINGMRHVTTRAASIITCLETPYGIVLAALILGETPSLRTILGGAVILGAAVLASARTHTNNLAPTGS